jgi:hypothetical protein
MDKKIYLNPGDPKICPWVEIDVGEALENPSALVAFLYDTIGPLLQVVITKIIALVIKVIARIPG